ncbi:LacI family DNA-binding transcriptional regulator [Terracidiphilus gabretensis]|jgi:LacI family transcriptional regulator|uniref:LacI family DNA-binding transcriptional regulator n=1 Tax=Terracidiphilus gabretensis TaxID=1577687 RepID=UPI00071B9E11|nr:LacI family DNA-binding transcriptional regulator [Terracidiphilus gabretensis]
MHKSHPHPTLAEVARKARVGTTTVSRVINGGERVSPDTLKRVQAVIDQLGYMPNQAARVLKGERAKTIGMVIPSIADPFFASCAEAAQAIARAHDSLLMVTVTNNDPRTEMENLNILTRHRTDGLLLAPANYQNQPLAESLHRMGIPVVTFDRLIVNSGIPSVLADNFNGARIATEHLISHGYSRILCLGGEPTLYTLRERLRGYRLAMQHKGLVPLVDMSVKDYKSAESAIENLLATGKPPDAIFTLKNSTTIYAFETLQKFKVPIPKSIALLGYDDFELASALRPAISVIQQPVEDIGRVAAEILFENLLSVGKGKNHEIKKRQYPIKLETKLVLRQSCGCRL